MPVEMGKQVCLPFAISLPMYVQEKGLLICQVVGEWVWNAAGPIPGFPGQKGRIWDIPLAADKFI